MNPLDKFVKRQNARSKIEFGVHMPLFPNQPGMSIAGSYDGRVGSNLHTCKRLHAENLEVLRLMPKLNLGGI